MPAAAHAPIGIVVAMEAELVHLRPHLTLGAVDASGPWRGEHAELDGIPLVVLCCRMGLINGAAATQHLIDTYRPRAVINYGCTGAHRRDILPGDVVIGTRTVHHSQLNILANGEELYQAGAALVGGESWNPSELDADPALLAAARAAAAGWTPEPWPTALWPAAVPYRTAQVHAGPVASADIWTQFQPRLDLLHARHGTLCEDMEAAAIAQVCALHEVPYIAIKDISNNEFHAATDIAEGFHDFPTAEVGKRAAALTLRLVREFGRPDRNEVAL